MIFQQLWTNESLHGLHRIVLRCGMHRFSEILMMMLFNLRLFLYHLDWSDGRAWNLLKLMSTFSKS